jgi:hypothetical protein
MSVATVVQTRVISWRGARGAARWCVPAVVLAIGLYALRHADAAAIGPLGLVSALPFALYVALALLTAGFLASLFGARPAPAALLAGYVVVFAVLLFGAATVVEPLPRVISGWLHVGFADYIARTGGTLPELDGRFSWPGFFALAAMGTRLAGLPDARTLLGWAPVVLNLLYATAVYRLARSTTSDPRTAWLAVWLFLPANWVGQDYFGPQGLNYLFYLVLLTVLLIWFRPRRHRRETSRWRRQEPAHSPGPAGTRIGLLVVVLLVFIASTASHQLTPVAIVLSVGALVLAGRCRSRSLPILLAVILAGYVSYLAEPYWSGHLRDMFGSVGALGTTVRGAAVDRVRGDPGHQAVVLLRVGLAVTVWSLAALGAWRRLRRGHGDLGLLALAGAPFLLLALQSYGGEIFLRVYAFTLPFMVVLLAGLVAPDRWPEARRVFTATVVGLLAVALSGAFLIARYGNESFERVRPADLAAVDWLYANAPAGSSLVAATSNVPWRSRDIERYRYEPLNAALGPAPVPVIEARMRANPRGAYLLLTRGQYVYAETFLGEPPGWGAALERDVLRSGRFRMVYANAEAKVFLLARPGVGRTDGRHG